MNKRIAYFDYLRILATFAVVVLHVSAENFKIASWNTFAWQPMNIYNSISRWGVPVFVMMSGALFLGNERIDIKKLFQKYIVRIVIAFVFWSAIYAGISKYLYKIARKEFFLEILSGHYHMWFLFMIVGLYMMVPILKKVVEDKILLKYFLLLSTICVSVIPFAISIISLFSGEVSSVLNQVLVHARTPFNLEYVGYFVLGYYLNKVQINSKKKRWFIYAIGIIGFVATIVLTYVGSNIKGYATAEFYKNTNINVWFVAVAIFLFAKQHWNKMSAKAPIRKLVQVLSKYSFGAYLAHVVILEDLSRCGINSLTFQPLISIPLISALIFVLAYIVAILLSKIAMIGKYIV